MKKFNQSGFSVVEVLIVVVVIGVLGGAGYFVMQRNKKTDSPATTQNSQSDSSTDTAKQTDTTASDSKKLSIAKWGVSGTYTGSTELTAKIDNNGAVLSSAELEAAAPGKCGYVIVRYKASEQVQSSAGFELGVASEYFAAEGAKQDFAHVGDYYYTYMPPQTNCSDAAGLSDPDTKLEAKQNTVFKAGKEVLKSLSAE